MRSVAALALARRSLVAAWPLAALAAALALVLVAAALGGAPAALVDVPSLLIVLGGTVMATIASFEPADLTHLHRSLAGALHGTSSPKLRETLEKGLELATTAQREGMLALEQHRRGLARWPVLRRGLALAVDGAGARLGPMLEPEIEDAVAGHATTVAILRRAAEVAPATGLIGTLVGLVRMLGSLDEPDAIGAAMAVALLTTLYGALLAHLVLLPLAERVSRLAAGEIRVRRLEGELACAIARGESPARLRERLDRGDRDPASGRQRARRILLRTGD